MIAIICTSMIAILAPRDSPRKNPCYHWTMNYSTYTWRVCQDITIKLLHSWEFTKAVDQCFFCQFLRSRWTGHHAAEDFVKFGGRSDKKVESSGIPSTYWRQGRTDCLKLASPRKNSSKTGEFSGFFRNFPSGSS